MSMMSTTPITPITSTIPEAIHHWFTLSDGRKFSYYTFRSPSQEANPMKHSDSDDDPVQAKPQEEEAQEGPVLPVLYLHGFPGCGLEGALAAAKVAAAGGELYAPDRPGFGKSDPLPLPSLPERESSPLSPHDEEDCRIERTVSDLWEFVHHQKWPAFSVIGVSGGGPYALAFLASYLDQILTKDGDIIMQQKEEQQHKEEQEQPRAKLLTVSIVAGVCCCADGGVDDLLEDSQRLVRAIAARKTSFFNRVFLRSMFILQRFFIRMVPSSVLMQKLVPPDVPEVDREIVLTAENGIVGSYLIDSVRKGVESGDTTSMEQEACALFWMKPPAFHESLRSHYSRHQNDSFDVSENFKDTTLAFPKVALFQGLLDKNVPPSHSKYVHEKVLLQKTQLLTYPDLGHVSMIVQKSPEYARFAVWGELIQSP